jgi:hypothetical protein
MKRPDNIHDALRHLQNLTMGIARDTENYLDSPGDYVPSEYFEDVKDAALDAHMLVTWVRDNLKGESK